MSPTHRAIDDARLSRAADFAPRETFGLTARLAVGRLDKRRSRR
jgi:hypothetical protein